MSRMKFSALLLALPFLLLCGCSSIDTHQDPSVDLSRIKTVFVERRLADDHHIDQIITDELTALGIKATNGPLTMKPDKVDAIITYTDRWEWDFKAYLIEMNIRIRDAYTDKPLAEVSYYRPAIIDKKPDAVVHQILPPLFKNRPVKSKVTINKVRDPSVPDSLSEPLPSKEK